MKFMHGGRRKPRETSSFHTGFRWHCLRRDEKKTRRKAPGLGSRGLRCLFGPLALLRKKILRIRKRAVIRAMCPAFDAVMIGCNEVVALTCSISISRDLAKS